MDEDSNRGQRKRTGEEARAIEKPIRYKWTKPGQEQ